MLTISSRVFLAQPHYFGSEAKWKKRKKKKIYSSHLSPRGHGITSTLRCGYLSFSTLIPSPKPSCSQRPICHWSIIQWPLELQWRHLSPAPLLTTLGAIRWPCWVVSTPLAKHKVAQIQGHWGYCHRCFHLCYSTLGISSLYTCLSHEENTTLSKTFLIPKATLLTIYKPLPKII